MTFAEDELHRLLFAVHVAEAKISPDMPTAKYLPALRAHIKAELCAIARTRNHCLRSRGKLVDTTEFVGTAEAAKIFGCSQRRIQQRIQRGDFEAIIVAGRYLIRREEIA